ncbi:MAG: hypothetical protein EOO69_01770 [Moraxellaceae bacterium]|nr:MAG: hypothetical protein EOO69_01770 [Moraxellaceae bacterium]
MVNIIKRGGFREQATRQLKYKNSVNQRASISAQKIYPPAHHNEEEMQDNIVEEKLEQPDPTLAENCDKIFSNPKPENDTMNKNS